MKNNFILIIFLILVVQLTVTQSNFADNGNFPEILFIKDDDLAGESLFYKDIIKLGYSAEVILPASVTPEKLNQYELVVLSTGNYPFACQNSNMRLAVQTFITDNPGKVIIEGGSNGYIADVFPGYPGFKNKVIKIDNWVADNGGSLNLSASHSFSNLALEPNILPASLNINYTSIYNQDVCTNNTFSELFYGTEFFPGKAGILVAPNVNNPQIINYFVAYSSFADNSEALKLLENSIFNLIGKPVSVNNVSDVVPENYFLYQNYPNPFNPKTKIKFEIASAGYSDLSLVRLSVFSITGKLVSEILNGNYSSGTYEADFDAGNLPGGVYFYKLTAEGKSSKYSQTRKMIIIK